MGIVLIDIVEYIPFPFVEDELLQTVIRMFDSCYTKEPPAFPAQDIAIVSKLGGKNWSAATRGKKLVAMSWKKDIGYIVYPTMRGHGGGYQEMTDKGINIGNELEGEALLNAVQSCLNSSLR